MNIFQDISLGNDVVDFSDQDSVELKASSDFVKRVFTRREVESFYCLYPGDDLSKYLWRIWAAKEAAYKAIKRVSPQIFFSPSMFEFYSQGEGKKYLVTHEMRSVSVEFSGNSEFEHALAIWNPSNIPLKTMHAFREISDIENDLIIKKLNLKNSYSRESSLCQTWTEYHLRSIFYDQEASIIKNPEKGRAPEIFVAGKNTGHLLSLSHHGRYCGIFHTLP